MKTEKKTLSLVLKLPHSLLRQILNDKPLNITIEAKPDDGLIRWNPDLGQSPVTTPRRSKQRGKRK